MSDILVIKIDENQNRVWQRTFGTEGKYDVGYQCLEVSDGYILAGGTYVDESHPQERWLAKVDKDWGHTIWERVYVSDLTAITVRSRVMPFMMSLLGQMGT